MNIDTLCPGCMEERGPDKTCPHCGYDQTAGPASSHHLPPGTVLQDKYLLGRVIGQGGFGITYIAWDMTLDLKLAIKEFFPLGIVARSAGKSSMEVPTGERGDQYCYGLERFLREAKTLARFSEHPNIVTVRDFFKANGTAYMIMNYIEGLTLEEYLSQQQGKIPFSKTLDIIMPVLDALCEVHEAEIMHRDISPDNILINKKGRVILIDFGAARQEMREKSKSLSVILKAGYAPEEQYRSRGQQGPWTDIYAAAATIYRCITGEVPPEALDRLAEDCLVSPSELKVDIESTREAALLKALSIRAEGRFQAVKEFQTALMSAAVAKEAAEPVKEKERIVAPSEKAMDVVNLDLDAEYYIDYANGTMPIGNLPIGARVVDPGWEWEFKTGDNYTGSGEIKAITWIFVAKDHYDIKKPHVTLLSEELIGRYTFDYSKSMLGLAYGKNHWGNSGNTNNASRGLRPWLNSTGIHAGEGFYRAFSESFKSAVLNTTLPNKEWQNGSAYSTQDKVFIPSTTELGDIEHDWTYQNGSVYPYFQEVGNAERVARLGGEVRWYWTRSPDSLYGSFVRFVDTTGIFHFFNANYDLGGVRPALNLKADTLVSEIRD